MITNYGWKKLKGNNKIVEDTLRHEAPEVD